MDRPLRFVVADDHPVMREGVIKILREHFIGCEVMEAEDYRVLLKNLRNWRNADLMIIDYYMPGMDSPAGIALVRSRAKRAKILVMSASIERDDVNRALNAGASGYVPKILSSARLLEAIDVVMKGGGTFVPFGELTEKNKTAPRILSESQSHPRDLGLSPREYEVLLHIASGESNKEIGRHLGIAEGTVKQHTSSIYRLLSARNRMEAVVRAEALGLHLRQGD